MPPILTARVGTNAPLFNDILRLYVPPGSRVLDMTYGRGAFWKGVEREDYRVVTMDNALPAALLADFTSLPIKSSSLDAFVLDPPYANGGGAHKTSSGIDKTYNLPTGNNVSRVRGLYVNAIVEGTRALRPGGVAIIKCQDQIESGKQWLVHVNVLNSLRLRSYIIEDIFVLVRPSTPMMRHAYQLHARKNHSYFIVARKGKEGR
jgi:hypothetical protein